VIKSPAAAGPRAAATSQLEALVAELRRVNLGASTAWGETDLTLTQLRALALIELRQPITIGALSSALHMSLASGSALADRLVRAELLQRRHDDDDRRQVLLQLAPLGVRLLRRIEERSRARLRRALTAMTSHERTALATALSGFIRVLREQSGGDS
jgi:DNA-binding MarR family transcriptional regulator